MLWLGGTPPVPQLVLQTGMNEFEKNWWRWRAVRTEKIEELLLAWMHPGLEHSGNSQRIRFLFLKRTLDWKLPLTTTSIWNTLTWTTTSIWNIFEHSTHRQVAVRISPPWLKSLTDLFLVRSEITCHIIVSCQKKCLFAVAQHNIFELAPTWNNEDSSQISWWVQSSNNKNISECKHLQGTKPIE